MPTSWANIVTKDGTHQQTNNATNARAATSGTGRSAVQRRAQTSNTTVTVIRYHGVDDAAMEAIIQKMAPAHIVSEMHGEVECLSGGKVLLLGGHWSKNKDAHVHNFVYKFKGRIPFETIYPLRNVLVKPLLTGHLVPMDGWCQAQLRNVITTDHDGVVFTSTQIEEELWRNTFFKNAILCFAPHWQGNINNLAQKPRSTVKIVYVDESGQLTAAAQRDGVFMFNEKAHFIFTGDTPTITLCGRCHRIGHATNSTHIAATSPAAHTTLMITRCTAPTSMTWPVSADADSRASTARVTTMTSPRRQLAMLWQ
ncbi:hypothetical protein EDB86DRAFT_2832402 [Lactarius hatsudake]|nr:hypothetical protein EDB86DRAFT_2832402 [Lactarius hatsudake]